MSDRRPYRKKADRLVTAIQLDLETDGFEYQKWGDRQRCQAGDWLVNNDGDVYTVDRDTFERTYQSVSQGLYQKTQTVWAEPLKDAGRVKTQEGWTHYQPGDYLVCNDAEGQDCYSMDAETFHAQYEPLNDDSTGD